MKGRRTTSTYRDPSLLLKLTLFFLQQITTYPVRPSIIGKPTGRRQPLYLVLLSCSVKPMTPFSLFLHLSNPPIVQVDGRGLVKRTEYYWESPLLQEKRKRERRTCDTRNFKFDHSHHFRSIRVLKLFGNLDAPEVRIKYCIKETSFHKTRFVGYIVRRPCVR